MSRLRSIWLVAEREIIERGRSRGFILSVLFTTLLVVGSIILPSILFNDDDPTQVGPRRAGSGRPRRGDDSDRVAVRRRTGGHDLPR